MQKNQFDPIDSVEQFISVVTLMHTTKDPDDIETCDKLMRDLTKSMNSWIIIKNILTTDNVDSLAIFSAAKILQTKVQYDLVELKKDEYSMFFDFLLEILIKFKKEKKSIRMYLEECIIMIYMRLFEQRPDFIDNLLTKFGQELFHIFLEFVELIPKIANDECVVIEDECRNGFIQFQYKTLQPKIMKILHLSVNEFINCEEKIKYLLLKTFNEWL